jgi:F-type H+-transporting ATPase subunit gamma
MANLKELRNRIVTVSSTMQITSAMKMVSAAKLKRAQDAITDMRPYAKKLEEILVNVSATLDSTEGVYSAKTEKPSKVLLVAISSNRGLAGSFNANILKKAVVVAAKYPDAQVEIMGLGKKAAEILQKREYNVTTINTGIFDSLSFDNTAEIAESLMAAFRDGKYDRIELI